MYEQSLLVRYLESLSIQVLACCITKLTCMLFFRWLINRALIVYTGLTDLCETPLRMIGTHYFFHGSLNTEVIEQNANGASWKIKLFPYPVGKIALTSFLPKTCIKYTFWQSFIGFTNPDSFNTCDGISSVVSLKPKVKVALNIWINMNTVEISIALAILNSWKQPWKQ
jgi:hypothetical protein